MSEGAHGKDPEVNGQTGLLGLMQTILQRTQDHLQNLAEPQADGVYALVAPRRVETRRIAGPYSNGRIRPTPVDVTPVLKMRVAGGELESFAIDDNVDYAGELATVSIGDPQVYRPGFVVAGDAIEQCWGSGSKDVSPDTEQRLVEGTMLEFLSPETLEVEFSPSLAQAA